MAFASEEELLALNPNLDTPTNITLSGVSSAIDGIIGKALPFISQLNIGRAKNNISQARNDVSSEKISQEEGSNIVKTNLQSIRNWSYINMDVFGVLQAESSLKKIESGEFFDAQDAANKALIDKNNAQELQNVLIDKGYSEEDAANMASSYNEETKDSFVEYLASAISPIQEEVESIIPSLAGSAVMFEDYTGEEAFSTQQTVQASYGEKRSILEKISKDPLISSVLEVSNEKARDDIANTLVDVYGFSQKSIKDIFNELNTNVNYSKLIRNARAVVNIPTREANKERIKFINSISEALESSLINNSQRSELLELNATLKRSVYKYRRSINQKSSLGSMYAS